MSNFKCFSAGQVKAILLFVAITTYLLPSNAINNPIIASHQLENENFNISLMDQLVDNLPFSVTKVVLDAGHGGKDTGCRGDGSKEKDIALSITKKVGEMIENAFPDVEVIYTRTRDEFIPLHKRAEIANQSKADLFISIHCNAASASAMGTETYVMGLHRAKENLEVAKRENASVLLEKDYAMHYDGFDPNSDEGHITLSVFQNAFLDQSIAFAQHLEKHFADQEKRVSRGVKQAGFLVLRNTVMPSVLIEAGFLTNAEEEEYLASDKGQKRIAESIYMAFEKYKGDMEGNYESTVVQAQIAEDNMEEQLPPENITTSTTQVEEELVSTNSDLQKVQQEDQLSSNQSITVTDLDQAQQAEPAKGDLQYVIQVAASSKKFKPNKDRKWNEIADEIMIRVEKDLYKYQVGYLSTYQEAIRKKMSLKEIGFEDAFVVAYFNNKSISVTDAVNLE